MTHLSAWVDKMALVPCEPASRHTNPFPPLSWHNLGHTKTLPEKRSHPALVALLDSRLGLTGIGFLVLTIALASPASPGQSSLVHTLQIHNLLIQSSAYLSAGLS